MGVVGQDLGTTVITDETDWKLLRYCTVGKLLMDAFGKSNEEYYWEGISLMLMMVLMSLILMDPTHLVLIVLTFRACRSEQWMSSRCPQYASWHPNGRWLALTLEDKESERSFNTVKSSRLVRLKEH